MKKDPVCGMEVKEDSPFTTEYEGEAVSFCSKHCQETFEKDPEKYAPTLAGDLPRHRKVVIVGAGQVGATFAFALMISGLVSRIVLVDARKSVAEGHAQDLNHGLQFAPPAGIKAGGFEDCRDADIVVITAGAAQKPGETRLDLTRKNAALFREIIPPIKEQNPRILLIVSNPVDILTHVALKVSGFPMNRVLGSGTVLDTARFRFLLSRNCRVDPRNVHAYIIGEHGDSELPVWSQANIGGIPFSEFCALCTRSCSPSDRDGIFHKVKNAAYEIIEKKGATNFAVAMALVRICGCILRDENSVLTVSSLVDDYYGISGVCLSVPSIVGREGLKRQLNIPLDDGEIQKLKESSAVLAAMLKDVEN